MTSKYFYFPSLSTKTKKLQPDSSIFFFATIGTISVEKAKIKTEKIKFNFFFLLKNMFIPSPLVAEIWDANLARLILDPRRSAYTIPNISRFDSEEKPLRVFLRFNFVFLIFHLKKKKIKLKNLRSDIFFHTRFFSKKKK